MSLDSPHSLLRRQLKRCFGPASPTPVPAPWQEFVAAVDAAYWAFDRDRAMLERALDLSSQELLEAGAGMRAVLQALPDLLLRLDARGELVEVKLGGAGGANVNPSVHLGPELRAAAARAVVRDAMEVFEYALGQADGPHHYEARLVPLMEGQVLALIRDITERKHAEQELQRTVSLVRSTLDSTADGILVVDRAGRIVSFNQRFVTLWRIPRSIIDQRDDEVALRHVLEQLRDPDAFLRRVRELYANPEAESSDVVEFKDGRVFERYSTPQLLEGVPIGRVWSFRDVTRRKQLEEQFLQVQKMEAVGRLAGGVAHDFNNLLTVILSSLTLLRADGVGGELHRTMLDDCLQAAHRAANLTGQLLTFSRRQRFAPADLDLNEVVANTTKMLQRLIGEHITLETRFAPRGAHVEADRGMIEQALMNLAVNSRDAMPKGGRLRLETALVDITTAEAEARPRARFGAFVRVTVSDTGCGIAPDDLPHIFEPFFTTKGVGKGTGLGLATVFGIIDQHGGWIEVESNVGVGTTMHLFLPRLRREASPPPPLLPERRPRGGRETILLVEDEREVRAVMKVMLERQGYCVHVAASADEALRVWPAHREAIDLLVTDVVMPGGVSGRDLTAALRAQKPGLKVILCSGYTDEALGPDSLLRDHASFLAKPFDMQVFLGRVRECLDDS